MACPQCGIINKMVLTKSLSSLITIMTGVSSSAQRLYRVLRLMPCRNVLYTKIQVAEGTCLDNYLGLNKTIQSVRSLTNQDK